MRKTSFNSIARFAPCATLAVVLAGCGEQPPPDDAVAGTPLGRPEAVTEPAPTATPPAGASEAAEPAKAVEAQRNIVHEAVVRELDELQRRYRVLAEQAAERPEESAAATALLADIDTGLKEARAELDAADAAVQDPEQTLALQSRMTSRLGELATMLDSAAALVEQARTAPVALPDLGDIPPPEQRTSPPKGDG